MDETLERKMEMLKLLAKTDYKYMKLERKLLWLELEFSDIIKGLSDEQQDIVWDFVLSSNDLDRYLLEVACSYIDLEQLEKG